MTKKQERKIARVFAKAVKAAREDLGLTQSQLAAKCGFSRQTVWNAEHGRNIRLLAFVQLTKVLGLDAHELVVKAGRVEP